MKKSAAAMLRLMGFIFTARAKRLDERFEVTLLKLDELERQRKEEQA